MTTNTILLIFLSLLIAGTYSYYNYYYKAKIKLKVHLVLALLRFTTVFCVLLLLINPIISNKTLEIIKTPLVISVDNSSSISDLKARGLKIKSVQAGTLSCHVLALKG